jgi:hypothetical protein
MIVDVKSPKIIFLMIPNEHIFVVTLPFLVPSNFTFSAIFPTKPIGSMRRHRAAKPAPKATLTIPVESTLPLKTCGSKDG